MTSEVTVPLKSNPQPPQQVPATSSPRASAAPPPLHRLSQAEPHHVGSEGYSGCCEAPQGLD
jgi:hypothetical protein